MKKLLTGLAIFGLLIAPLQAEKVTLDNAGLSLNANLEKAADDWAAGPVVLMTHGTLAYNGMEIMAGLQQMLLDRGITTLAINLSLGLNDRTGMYDCKVPHTHKHTDAVTEIGLWLGWLKGQGATDIALLGHSRGGNQTAQFAAANPDSGVSQLFLIAPATWSADEEAKSYQKKYAKELAPILAEAKKLVADGKGDSMMTPVDFIYCEQASARADSFVDYYQDDNKNDTPFLLPSIKSPVIVFAGTDDKVVKSLIEKVEPLTNGGNIRLEVIEGADHFFRDLYSEDIADIIEESL